jgi:hypothetical protein
MPAANFSLAATLGEPDSHGSLHLAFLFQGKDRSQNPRQILRSLALGLGRDLLVHPLGHLAVKARARFVLSASNQAVLDSGDPAVDDVVQRPTRAGAGGQLLHHLPVHVVEFVEMQVVVRNHDEAGGEPSLLGIQHRQSRHEGLAAAIATAQELEHALACRRHIQLAPDFAPLALDAHGKGVQPALGNNT